LSVIAVFFFVALAMEVLKKSAKLGLIGVNS